MQKTDISSVPGLSVGRFLSYAKTSALRRKQNFNGSWPISRKVPFYSKASALCKKQIFHRFLAYQSEGSFLTPKHQRYAENRILMVPGLSVGRFLFIPKHQRYAENRILMVPGLSVGRFLSYAKTSALRRKQNFNGSWPVSRKVPECIY